MRATAPDALQLTPTDLTVFTACAHASRLEVDRALGRAVPERGRDPDVDLLAELGRRHEAAYLAHLEEQGLRVVRLSPLAEDADERLVEAMRAGVDVIAQAPLRDAAWFGIADVLRRVEARSDLGPWRYEVQDTKLATTTRAATVLQLLTYARLLERLQGTRGEFVHVVAPGDPFEVTSMRVEDFDAVTGLATERFESFVERALAGEAHTEPEPVEHCMVCPWWASCRATWRERDHLSLVANLGGARRSELERHGVETRGELAARRDALGFEPGYGRPEGYLDAAQQADVQVRSDGAAVPVVERLPGEDDRGLALLPERHPHDLYLDLEGTPFFPGGGLEYLWGWCVGDAPMTQVWAFDRAAEKRAFERFVDEATAHLVAHPGAHIVHFGAYEPSALKRLMGRHATREEELDALLRREAFVDLLTVVKQGFRIGVESYSLKDLERVHGFVRDEDLRTLGPHKRSVEHATVLGVPDEAADEDRLAVARYNADDVRSTVALHRWLSAERIEGGVPPRPVPETDGEPGEELAARQARVRAVSEALLEGVPDEPEVRDAADAARVLLANLLDFERREAKVNFWVKFAHQAMTTEELEASPKGITGLERLEVLPLQGREKVPRVVYRYPAQDVDVRSGEALYVPDGDGFTALQVEVDPEARRLVVKQGKGMGERVLTHGYFWNHVRSDVIADARLDFAEDVVARGVAAAGPFQAVRDLLTNTVGRTADGLGASLTPGERPLDAAKRLALALEGGVLPVQGPPGAGKTYTGARTILALVAAGQRVAVTALSHKAIANLLEAVLAAATAEGVLVRVGQAVSGDREVVAGARPMGSNDVAGALASGRVDVVGGTAWVWTRGDLRQAVDTLVIDEAGQFSLAVGLSVATAARNLVLLGDPQQLTQPIQGAHPEGAEVSALEHLLDGNATLPEGRGLFLPESWRMHPSITDFVSRSFYEGRLRSVERASRVALRGTEGFDGAGIAFEPVVHEGRDGVAPEEVTAAQEVLQRLLQPGATFTESDGHVRPLTQDDVLVIAPFNRHVDALERGLPGVKVGTVDRLQGQEAPVVLYALGVSSLDLAPRGVGFLFDLHRCNVAVSRAQGRVVVIASPRLFEEVPGSVAGLRLVNAHVRLVNARQG